MRREGAFDLDVAGVLGGARLLVIGGTGFLGKLFWSMLLDRYPGVGKIFLVVRKKEGGAAPAARFTSEIVPSAALGALRRAHGAAIDAFLADKVAPIDGHMGRPRCGIDEALVRELRGTIDAVVNVAGVVDFNPPLDEAIEANAFGAQNLVALARALGDVPVLHTSTCYVAGTRRGPIFEQDPRAVPFPRAGEIGVELWDPAREIAECLDLIAQARQRSDDAFRQSEFAEEARGRLERRGEPQRGVAFDRELARVKRAFVSERLVEAGLDRATHWGWPNIYLYTKAIGEQVIAASGLPFAIARPAACESTVAYPEAGYNEGINTSAPFAYLIMKGEPSILGKHVLLDLVPADFVAAGMVLALAELLEGSAKPVYQLGAADVNPCTVQRFGELMGLYKRRHYRTKGSGNVLFDALQARYEPSFVERGTFERLGAPARAAIARDVASFVRRTVPALAPAAAALEGAARRDTRIAEIQRIFEPFTSKLIGPFDCSNTRAAFARLSPADRARLPWAPESIDWADWMMNVHMPAMERYVIPEMDRRAKREPRPLAPHQTLVTLLDEVADRFGPSVALQRMTGDGLTRTSFADVRDGAEALSARLAAAGVRARDRVALSGRNDPDWAVAFFGILWRGATVVPVDPALDAAAFRHVLAESRARAVVWDDAVQARHALLADEQTPPALDLHRDVEPDEASDTPDDAPPEPDEAAVLVFTSFTSGGSGASARARPASSGVTLTHASLTSLVAALAPVFPLRPRDAVLSVLPLHHTFELTCGLLLPLSRGARVVYAGEASAERMMEGLEASRAAAVVGVPALWQMLERHILEQVDARGPRARAAFDVAREVNRWLGAHLGVDVGRLLFGEIHAELGGNIRWLISGGGALSRETQKRFASLGLRLKSAAALEETWLEAVDLGRPSEASHATNGAPARRALAADVPPVILPEPARRVGKAILGKAADVFYGDVMKPRVFGQAHIPHNRNVIVVANHTSHLDMGFVRYALGEYGHGLVSLAAQDYFFESGVKRAFFENLTNLKPLDRRASLRQAIRQASEVIEQGKTVLVFPEGTRSANGEIQEFKPLVGHLALVHGVDILPVHLGGLHAAMPKGTRIPTRRDIVARIGPPLCTADLRRITAGLTRVEATREVTRLAQAAVEALRDGQMLDLSRIDGPRGAPEEPRQDPLAALFAELEAKFRAGEVERPVSYYVTLGSDDSAKWTVRVDARGCAVRPGKPDGGQADCVMKTSPEIFARIVREAYVPSPADFLSGAFKSNDIGLLMTFQRVFQ
ncbi:MAG: AMP-binding protein, partial [Polyangiaceae bacterium]|nr:AMP-binding protein [Polyangiaceae bacterium]